LITRALRHDVQLAGVSGQDAMVWHHALASAACPLTDVMQDQIRAEPTGLSGVDEFRVDWLWLPPGQPAGKTARGSEQLRAIGFTI
jgi:metal-sulfur cluster biosynthetic enzyme